MREARLKEVMKEGEGVDILEWIKYIVFRGRHNASGSSVKW